MKQHQRKHEQNFPMSELASHKHPTPFLLMNIGAVTAKYEEFRRVLPEIDVYYAIKCNPDFRVAEALRQKGCKFEVASFPEVELLKKAGVAPKDIIFSNPVKRPKDIARACKAGVHAFAFDSPDEVAKLAKYAPGSRVYVRLATRPAASTVPSEGKFGVSEEQCRELMNLAVSQDLIPYGIAFHVGSQMENTTAWPVAIEQASALMRDLEKDGIRIKYLDLGGAFPAYYGAEVPELDEYAKTIQASLVKHLPYKVSLGIEPGRGLVADAGVMVATVIGVVQRGKKFWVHLDVGAFNGMMEALETQNAFKFPLIDSRQNPEKVMCNLTGPSCDSQDTIMFDVPISRDIATGDKVYIFTAGAYTTSYASRFNGFDIPKVYYL